MAKKFNTYEEALQYVQSLPINELVNGYAMALFESEKIEPIRISESQFRTMFRIIGKTADGSTENRGRKAKC